MEQLGVSRRSSFTLFFLDISYSTQKRSHEDVERYYSLIDIDYHRVPRLSQPVTEMVIPLKPLEAIPTGEISDCLEYSQHLKKL